jgi:hypothetical protein
MPLTDKAADLFAKQLMEKLRRTPSRTEVREAHAECMKLGGGRKAVISCMVKVLNQRRPEMGHPGDT